MINENILSMFKSHKDPPFSIIITDIEQKNECGQDSIKIKAIQVNKPICEIKGDSRVVERELSIITELDIDENELYRTKLVGYISNEKLYKECSQPNSEPSFFAHTVEMVDVRLQEEIKISFNKKYISLPKIIINTEKQYESLYRNISYEFIKSTEDDIEYYEGVIITFNNLKMKKSYPVIGIIIIGDEESKSVLLETSSIIINDGEEIDIIARVKDSDGKYITGKDVDFYLETDFYDVDHIDLKVDKNIIQGKENVQLLASLINKTGQNIPYIEGKNINFYLETDFYNANNIDLKVNKDIIKDGENIQLTASLINKTGQRIPNKKTTLWQETK